MTMKTLFLQAPSFEGFDGGAGSRYQAKREIRSFWYPTWLAQPAAMIPGSRLLDAPPADVSVEETLRIAGGYDLCIIHTSTPSFPSDVRMAEALKEAHPKLMIGMVGAKVAVEPEESLQASAAIDFVAREEFDFTLKEIAEGRPLAEVDGVSYRSANGTMVHTPDRAVLEDMDPAICLRGLQARSAYRRLLHRLSQAPLHFPVYGPRLPLQVYLLPLAPDRGRPPLSHAQRGKRPGRDPLHPEEFPPGQGDLLRRRHLYR